MAFVKYSEGTIKSIVKIDDKIAPDKVEDEKFKKALSDVKDLFKKYEDMKKIKGDSNGNN